MTCGLSQIRVDRLHCEDVPCLISLQSSSYSDPSRMYSCDFVCLIDVSGSMQGERLGIVKETLGHMIGMLEDSDRVCLITFSDQARCECGLVRCSKQGKVRLKACINSFDCGDLTNISQGLRLAMEMISRRRQQNFAVTLLVFTDGKHSVDDHAYDDCREILESGSAQNMSLIVLGFGEDLDTKILELLARKGHGTFYHITSLDDIPEKFGLAFATATTVVAWNIFITLRLNDTRGQLPCKIKKLYSKEGEDQFFVPAIIANTQKDFVFELIPGFVSIPAPANFSPVSAVVEFVDNENVETRLEANFSVTFLPWTVVKPPQKSEVLVHWHRIKGASQLGEARRLAELNQFKEAHALLENAIESLEASSEEGHFKRATIIIELLSDLKHAKELVESEKTWENGGESHFASISYKHSSQSALQSRSVYASSQERERTMDLMRWRRAEEQKSDCP